MVLGRAAGYLKIISRGTGGASYTRESLFCLRVTNQHQFVCTEKSQNSKHNFLNMSETSKNGVFQARRRRKNFENRDFLSFAPPLFSGPK